MSTADFSVRSHEGIQSFVQLLARSVKAICCHREMPRFLHGGIAVNSSRFPDGRLLGMKFVDPVVDHQISKGAHANVLMLIALSGSCPSFVTTLFVCLHVIVGLDPESTEHSR
jgi:hypothetical protein